MTGSAQSNGQVHHQIARIETRDYGYRAHCTCEKFESRVYRLEASAVRAAQQHADDKNAAAGS